MIALFRDTLRDIRALYRKLLLFEFAYLLGTSLLYVPLAAFIFNRMMRAMGSSYLLNGDVYKIALSYTGLLGLSLIVMLTVVVLFVEYGVVLVIAQKNVFGVQTRISDALLTTVRALPRLVSIGWIQLAMLFFFLIPFVDSPISDTFLRSTNLSLLFSTSWHQSLIFQLLYGVVAVGVVYLFLRWMFALHFILIEGRSTRRALKSSLALTRSRRIRVLLQLLLFNLLLFALGFLILSAIASVPSLFEGQELRSGIRRYVLAVTGFLGYLFTMLAIPVNILFITRLYYRLREERGVEVKDRLQVYSWNWLRRWEGKAERLLGQRTFRSLLLLMAAIYAATTVVLNVSFHDKLVYAKWNVMITSHRGDASEPENSLPAVLAAVERAVDAVEIDVQMSKDGVIVLHHDYSLRRMTGARSSVHDLTWKELRTMTIGTSGEDETPVGIPRLEEVLAAVQGRTKLVIEIKPYGDKHALARRVAELVETFDMQEDAYIQSQDYGVLQTIRAHHPNLKIGQIMYLAAGNLNRLDVDFYTIRQTMLTTEFVRMAHKQDREVWVWTVNLPANMKQVLTYDIDGIITDYPDRVQQLLGVKEEEAE